jgi:two-component system chemotaxis response regulator CheY
VKKKILLIEDNPVEAKLMSSLLSQRHEVQQAFNGLEGLEKLKTFAPDLIVLDINMPVMNGLDFYNKILDKNDDPRYPVFVLTARNDLEVLFRDFHVKGFMVKPVDLKKALVEIEAVLNGKVDEERERLKKYDSILIIDHDAESAKTFTKIFKDGKFREVLHAKTAVEGIEIATKKNPKLVLVQLGLPDIEGDLVILRMSQIFKTQKIMFFLITPREYERKHKIMERLESKSGVVKLIQYTKPTEVLQQLEVIFKQKIEDNPHDKENEVLLDLMMESLRKRTEGGGFNA